MLLVPYTLPILMHLALFQIFNPGNTMSFTCILKSPTHVITRCMDSRQPLVAQSGVMFTRRYLTLTLSVTIFISIIAIIPQGRAAEISRILCYNRISKCWLCTRVSHAHSYTATDVHRRRPVRRHKRQSKTPTCTYSFPFITSGHLVCSPYLHVGESLWWPIFIFATIQSRAQKCR